MTFEGLGEMFKGDSADTWAGKFPLMLMGGRVEGLACADPGARTPIGVSGNYLSSPVVTLRADQELRETLNQVQFAVKLPLLIDDILNCLILSIYQDGNLKHLVP